MIELLAFGIIIDDIVFPEGYTRMGVLGGGGPQTAWGMAAACGSGETVGLAAGVGADLEDTSLAPLRRAGINLDGVRTTEHPTPRAWQVVEFDGQRTQVWRVPPETLGAQLGRRWDVLPEHYQSARAAHWGIHPSENNWIAFAQELRARGMRISIEPFRPPAEPLDDAALREMLAPCTVFSPNWHEAQRITGKTTYRAVLDRFREGGARILALRRGADGADVWNLESGEGVRVPAVQTEVVDVVGAGNAFCGALLARLDDGLAEAAIHASAAASYLVEQVGIPHALPAPDDYARRVDTVRAGLEALTLDGV